MSMGSQRTAELKGIGDHRYFSWIDVKKGRIMVEVCSGPGPDFDCHEALWPGSDRYKDGPGSLDISGYAASRVNASMASVTSLILRNRF